MTRLPFDSCFSLAVSQSTPMNPHEAAQSIFPSLARALQKYLRITRQQPRHTMDSILSHLALCLAHDMTPRAFLEKYLVSAPVIQNDKERRGVQSWGLVCDQLLSRPINSGTVFQLRQSDVCLLCTISPIPHFSIAEEIIHPKSNKFVLRLNSETSHGPAGVSLRYSLRVAYSGEVLHWWPGGGQKVKEPSYGDPPVRCDPTPPYSLLILSRDIGVQPSHPVKRYSSTAFSSCQEIQEYSLLLLSRDIGVQPSPVKRYSSTAFSSGQEIQEYSLLLSRDIGVQPSPVKRYSSTTFSSCQEIQEYSLLLSRDTGVQPSHPVKRYRSTVFSCQEIQEYNLLILSRNTAVQPSPVKKYSSTAFSSCQEIQQYSLLILSRNTAVQPSPVKKYSSTAFSSCQEIQQYSLLILSRDRVGPLSGAFARLLWWLPGGAVFRRPTCVPGMGQPATHVFEGSPYVWGENEAESSNIFDQWFDVTTQCATTEGSVRSDRAWVGIPGSLSPVTPQPLSTQQRIDQGWKSRNGDFNILARAASGNPLLFGGHECLECLQGGGGGGGVNRSYSPPSLSPRPPHGAGLLTEDPEVL
ncbi:Vang-like protein 2 [Chionoecetes opilio]|uniref:Vang-like protein 2 n=1 Tax=Chionoecetes opilio TaxID=41210 RepID=A0A8J4YLX9_CHIOP|nr:Vang-like protein 2 [Chionoecetes opilio]